MSVLLAITLMLPQTAIGATTTETTTAVVETEEGNSAVDNGFRVHTFRRLYT